MRKITVSFAFLYSCWHCKILKNTDFFFPLGACRLLGLLSKCTCDRKTIRSHLICLVLTRMLEWEWVSDIVDCIHVYSSLYVCVCCVLNNGNWTEWSAIWSEIIHVNSKSNKRIARVRFEITRWCDFTPKLHDTKFNYLFTRSISKSHNFWRKTTRFWQ